MVFMKKPSKWANHWQRIRNDISVLILIPEGISNAVMKVKEVPVIMEQ